MAMRNPGANPPPSLPRVSSAEINPVPVIVQLSNLTVLIPYIQRDNWDHYQVSVSKPGSPQQCGYIAVPPGFDLVVRARSVNTQNIYVGKDKSSVLDSAKRITLAPGEAIKLKISNASAVWVDAAVANEGVEYFSEV